MNAKTFLASFPDSELASRLAELVNDGAVLNEKQQAYVKETVVSQWGTDFEDWAIALATFINTCH